MVPVGGSVAFAYDKAHIKALSEMYPGRASAAPIMDLFITFLQMGKSGTAKTKF
jgi:O-phospho-L-seryl-tRNASec:L-selenocysteinyl-tRNA synthase